MDRVAPCGALQALPPLLDAIGETARIAVQSTDPATIRVLAWRLLPQVHRLSGQDCCVSAAEFVWKHSDQQPLPSARRRVCSPGLERELIREPTLAGLKAARARRASTQRVLPTQPLEAAEVPVVGAHRAGMFDRIRGDVRVSVVRFVPTADDRSSPDRIGQCRAVGASSITFGWSSQLCTRSSASSALSGDSNMRRFVVSRMNPSTLGKHSPTVRVDESASSHHRRRAWNGLVASTA